MKKIITLIFSLFVGFLSFKASAQAIDGVPPQCINQRLCSDWWKAAKEILKSSSEKDLNNGSKKWAEQAVISARKKGIECQIYQLVFRGNEPYRIVVIKQDGEIYVCDYYKTVYELYKVTSKITSKPLPLMTYADYMLEATMNKDKILELIWSPDDPIYEPL